jgi:hypothetical protein
MALIKNPQLFVKRPNPISNPATLSRNINIKPIKPGLFDASIFNNIRFIKDIRLINDVNEINIINSASTANWTSGVVLPNENIDKVQTLPWMGSDGCSNGFVINSTSVMENNISYNVLRTHPMWVSFGMIKGVMPIKIDGNGTFKAKIGFLNGAVNSDGVTFLVNIYYHLNGVQTCQNVITKYKRYSGELVDISADLSKWANQDIQLELRVDAGASSGQDWAAWVNPVIDIQPVAKPNHTYNLITNKFITSDLIKLGISNVYQKTTVPDTFLIVPVSYSITLKDGKPFTYLENIVIMEDTTTDKSSATLILGLAPKISGYQLIKFKTLLKKSLNLNTEVSLEYPAGCNIELMPQSSFTLFGNVVLTYVGQTDNDTENHFMLSFSKLGLNDMAGFIKILSNSFALPVSLTVNSDADETSVLDISLLKKNITGMAVGTTPGTLNIAITNNTDNAVKINTMIIEDNTEEYDLSSLNITLAHKGDTHVLTFTEILKTLNIGENLLEDLFNLTLKKIAAAFYASYSNIHKNKFAFNYDVDYDERKILNVNYTEKDSNQMCLTVTCPMPNDLTLSGSPDFFDAYKISTIMVSFSSSDNKVIVPAQIPFDKDAPRYQFSFVLIPVGGDLTNKKISYQVTVKFNNGQADLVKPECILDLSGNNILELDGNTLNLKSTSKPT